MPSPAPPIRTITRRDTKAVLALNQAHIAETSALSPSELHRLTDIAFHTGIAGAADGFCIAMDQASAYDSPNFLWFAARHRRFVYVDRIIVAPEARGRGLARALYGALISAARAAGHEILCCEVNIDPPNPGSEAFHARLGFERVGAAVLEETGKKVGYWALRL
ncbi:MAG: GNAT family N-acetyltransferase [Hyphomicrobiales bacterium]|nr:MAG: GNAT family N-acetyltransferase [Hyphomicrobiales bacterium]